MATTMADLLIKMDVDSAKFRTELANVTKKVDTVGGSVKDLKKKFDDLNADKIAEKLGKWTIELGKFVVEGAKADEAINGMASAAAGFNASLKMLKENGESFTALVGAYLEPSLTALNKSFEETADGAKTLHSAAEMTAGFFRLLGTLANAAYVGVASVGAEFTATYERIAKGYKLFQSFTGKASADQIKKDLTDLYMVEVDLAAKHKKIAKEAIAMQDAIDKKTDMAAIKEAKKAGHEKQSLEARNEALREQKELNGKALEAEMSNVAEAAELALSNRIKEANDHLKERHDILDLGKTDYDKYIDSLNRVTRAEFHQVVSADEAAEAHKRLDDAWEKSIKHVLPVTTVQFQRFEASHKKVLADWEVTLNSMQITAAKVAGNLADVLGEHIFDGFKRGLAGLAEDFARVMFRMASNALAAKLVGGLFGLGSGLASYGLGGGIADAASGGFGQLTAGTSNNSGNVAPIAERQSAPTSGGGGQVVLNLSHRSLDMTVRDAITRELATLRATR